MQIFIIVMPVPPMMQQSQFQQPMIPRQLPPQAMVAQQPHHIIQQQPKMPPQHIQFAQHTPHAQVAARQVVPQPLVQQQAMAQQHVLTHSTVLVQQTSVKAAPPPQIVQQPYKGPINPQMLPTHFQTTVTVGNRPSLPNVPKVPILPQNALRVNTPQNQIQSQQVTPTQVSTDTNSHKPVTNQPPKTTTPQPVNVQTTPISTNTQHKTNSTSKPAETPMQISPVKTENIGSKKMSSTPEGVGAIYTHTETSATPPVFHYMPAPPTEIVLDSTAESFTKLW